MTDEQLQNIRESWKPSPGKTHYPGCEREHYVCAILLLREEVERLRDELPRARSQAVEEAEAVVNKHVGQWGKHPDDNARKYALAALREVSREMRGE